MNAAISKLYDEWYSKTGDANAAATLTAAELQTTRRKEKSSEPKKTSNLLTIKQAASEFNISERALYRLTNLHRRNGKSVRISRSDLSNHLDDSADLLN